MMSLEQPPKTDEIARELNALRSSREFMLGSRLHQSKLFKLIRHYRLRDQRIQISALGSHHPKSSAYEVRLLGVWFDYFSNGMPLDLLERDLTKWTFVSHAAAPYGRALHTSFESQINLYSMDENLRLDFQMDENSGQIEVVSRGNKIIVDLYSPAKTTVSIFPNRVPISVVINDDHLEEMPDQPAAYAAVRSGVKFSGEHLRWIEQQRANPRPVSINHPEWHGIRAAAEQLFDNVLTIPDTLDKERALYYAQLFREANIPSLTIQGFPKSYYWLVKAVRKMLPSLPVYVIYHGNFLHFREDYDWTGFEMIKALHDEGDLARVGFVKKGMAEIFTAQGMRASFIMNLVRQIPEGPSQPLDVGQSVGIWSQPDWSWKKPPYAMLAALKLAPGTTGYLFNTSPRARELADMLQIPVKVYPNGLPHAQALDMLAKMHLNMYISLTECAPMLPLESLSVGSPCLLGPTSHYFLDHEYLFTRLIVPQPDNAEIIGQYAARALEERDAIIQAYRQYAPDYNARALGSLSAFLEFPVQKRYV